MEGRILGNRYEVLNKIGSGGMAEVYKAKCRLLNRYVALKVLKQEFIDDEEFVKRFRIEAQSAASLSHPNIVSVYDVGKEGSIHYMVMEYIDGITLNSYIREKGSLDWQEAVRIAIQICSAIKHAHRHYIVHRDIKPQNIMLTRDGIAKVTDFGIARAATTTTITMVGNTIGSVHYFSPEQARGGYTDEKSDIYSLGIVMYEMLTGKPPFDGDAPVAVALKHLQAKPCPPDEINPGIPQGINSIIMKAIEKDLSTRYQNAENLLDDLYNVLKNPDRDFSGGYDKKDRINSSSTKRMNAITPEAISDKSEEKDTMGRRYKKRRKRDGAVLSALLISVVVIVCFTYLGYRIIEGTQISSPISKDKIRIDDYIGQDIGEVSDKLKKDGIIVEVNYIFSEEMAEDRIISQNVPSGFEFPKGGLLNIIKFDVSKGPERIILPDYADQQYLLAYNSMVLLGFNVELVDEFNEEVNPGLVIKTDPEKNAVLKRGEVIKLHYSKGVEIEYVNVPDLKGLNLEEARIKLDENKLTIGKLLPDNYVASIADIISQTPPMDTRVEAGTPIDLTFDPKTAVINMKYTVKLAEPEKYGDTINVYIEQKMSNQQMGEVVLHGKKAKSSFPFEIDVKVPADGHTEILIYLDNKDHITDYIFLNQ